jgi:hypothetical protein
MDGQDRVYHLSCWCRAIDIRVQEQRERIAETNGRIAATKKTLADRLNPAIRLTSARLRQSHPMSDGAHSARAAPSHSPARLLPGIRSGAGSQLAGGPFGSPSGRRTWPSRVSRTVVASQFSGNSG